MFSPLGNRLRRDLLTPLASVRDAMLPDPTVHPVSVDVADLRALFRDDHVHMALLCDRARLVATIERQDLPPAGLDRRPARAVGALTGRTITPDMPLVSVAAFMRRTARRRLAVVDGDGELVGLLCLKASGEGFCSSDDVRDRRAQARETRRVHE